MSKAAASTSRTCRPRSNSRIKVNTKAYRAAERNGIVWVYMGNAAKAPAPARHRRDAYPRGRGDDHLRHARMQLAPRARRRYRHLASELLAFRLDGREESSRPNDPNRFGAIHRDPDYKLAETELGTMYGAYRPADNGQTYWRIAHFMFPCWTFPPYIAFEHYRIVRGWVPLDDTHMMFVVIGPKWARASSTMSIRSSPIAPIGSAVIAWCRTSENDYCSTAICSGRAPIPASMACISRIRPTPKAWARSPITASRISR